MLWCEPGGAEPQDLEDLAVFVSQLDRAGLRACVDARAVPEGLSRNAQFDLAPYLRDGPPAPADRLALIAAHRLDDGRLMRLRRLGADGARDCVAYGSFASRQAVIGLRAKLSYVLGRDPRIVELAGGDHGRDAPVLAAPRRSPPAARPRLVLLGPDLTDRAQVGALAALALSRRHETAILTDGKSKQEWAKTGGGGIAIFHYGEILPAGLAERTEILVILAPGSASYRRQSLVANLALSGAALLDGTPGHVLARDSDGFIPAPMTLHGLGAFIEAEILPNLAEIGAHVRGSMLAARVGRAAVPDLRGPDEPPEASAAAPRPRSGGPGPGTGAERILFAPTNGVGLGHAQRCTLIADALDRARLDPVFAVFPSCMRLVRTCGYDAAPLIGRSPLHAQHHENDLANYLRLRALADGAAALVFDGGYVFDSVYRTILETPLPGVWIRRGLWQSTQDNAVALDREKAFARVIVPGEAFDELNVDYSRGSHLRTVGPIVQKLGLTGARRAALRERLAARYGDFERLVVTQLGAGVASDRGAQNQALCGMLERRPRVLHLVVVWPTAVIQPGWFGWSRSRVVKTHHAGALAAAADLCVSAAGYNCFHEALYGAIPTIFVPQTGSFMDDQRARSRSAQARGLCGLVEPHELMALEREIARFLDEGEAEAVARRLAALDLPEPGNAQAAALIEELTHGATALERPLVADRPAGRR